MDIVKSIYIEQYVENNKKEAEKVFPYIIRLLLTNTVRNIKKIDIPSGDDVIQTGFDGVISFDSDNKYLGDKECMIEIGTEKDYIKKANADISKREPNSECNFVFFTPYRWNSRKKSKTAWINEKKKIYKWNDIVIIDAKVLSNWLNEDIISAKYLLQKQNIHSDKILSIAEKENELKNKTVKGIGIDFFDYNDKEYEKILSKTNKEYYRIVAPTKEEALYITLYYLRKLGSEDKTIIVEDQTTWNELIKRNILNNAYLIPNFNHKDELEIPNNNITFLFYSEDEYLENYDYRIMQRTSYNLNNALQKYYKEIDGSVSYDKIVTIIKKTLGKYMPLKRELFKAPKQPEWYNEKDRNLYLYLFYINSFKSSDLKVFECFNIKITEIKDKLKKIALLNDPYIVYYKYWDEYKVVNVYNVIEWLGNTIDENNIEMFCKIVQKVLFIKEPRYLEENIDKDYYFDDSSEREYSKSLKNGVLKSLIITKLYLKKENKYSLYQKLDKVVSDYYDSITEYSEYLNFASIAEKIAEFDFSLYLGKINFSIGNRNFERMFSLKNEDSLFSSNEYYNILCGIEKTAYKKEFIEDSIEILVKLSEIKDSYYSNMISTPFNTLKTFFMGWDNLTCLLKEEKISILKKIINKHRETGRKLLISIFPSEHVTWTEFQKPEFDSYDELIPIKYISEQKEYFEEYYKLYLNNYVTCLEDILPIYNELFFIEFDCFESIKERTYELLKKEDDDNKYKLKSIINERINGYEKYHNSAWNLTDKQYKYLSSLRDSIKYENNVYEYLDLYQYNSVIDESTVDNSKQALFKLLKNDFDSIKILLDNCDNKRDLLYDLYVFVDAKSSNLNTIILLFNEYSESVCFYLDMIYKYETSDEIIALYRKLNNIDEKKRILLLSNAGYNEKLYEQIKGSKYESDYWNNLSIFRTKVDDYIYNSCLNYSNYKFCLEFISKVPEKYIEKCTLLEKIVQNNYMPNTIEQLDINRIFDSFHNSINDDILERVTRLEIYFNPILKNKSYFISKQASKYPEIVAEIVEILFKDVDGNSVEIANKEMVGVNCYKILNNLVINFDTDNYLEWCEKFLSITASKKRSQVSFHVLGKLLAKSGFDKEDGMMPIKNVRKIIEYYNSQDLNNSFKIGMYNQRGIHNVGIGEEEYALYKKYLDYSNNMKLDYPITAKIMKSIADNYRNESKILREEANYVEG